MSEDKSLVIAHIADVHVRNISRHEEYKNIFAKLYKDLKSRKIDLIVIAGDIFHSKTQLSPESLGLVSEFLNNLADITQVLVIPGNHDANLSNQDRMDALSPVVELLNHKNIYYFSKSEICRFYVTSADMLINLGVFSCIDTSGYDRVNEEIKKNTPNDKINIALYHGAINLAKTDIGFTFHDGRNPESFDNWDFVLLGDIHKRQDVNEKGNMSYPGSLIQQNFGESLDKGYLLWTIKSKTDWNKQFVRLYNSLGYYTLNIRDSKISLPNLTDVPDNARFRIIFHDSVNIADIKRIRYEITSKYNPHSISTAIKHNEIQLSNIDDNDVVNVRNKLTQEKLFRNYFEISDHIVDEDMFAQIWNIHEDSWNELMNTYEEAERFTDCKIKKLEFENLFSYRGEHKIDFEKMPGITGIFGANASGKSAIVDILLYVFFCNTSRFISKIGRIVNNKEDVKEGWAKVYFAVGDTDYYIYRKTTKLTNKYEEFIRFRSDVEFYRKDKDDNWLCLNGIQRTETEKMIRNIIGTIEDITVTSISPQNALTKFIDYGSTDKKKMLNKFLDIDVFSVLYDLAKEKANTVERILKNFKKTDYNQLRIQCEKSNKLSAMELTKIDSEKKLVVQELENSEQHIIEYSERIYSDIEDIDISKIHRLLEANNDKIKEHQKELEETKQWIVNKNDEMNELKVYLSDDNPIMMSIAVFNEQLSNQVDSMERINKTIHTIESSLEQQAKTIKFFDSNRCDSTGCKFMEKIGNFLEEQPTIRDKVEELKVIRTTLVKAMQSIESQISEKRRELKVKRDNFHRIKLSIAQRKVKQSNVESAILKVDNNIGILQREIARYELNSKKIEENTFNNKKIKHERINKESLKIDLEFIDTKINKIRTEIIVNETKITQIKEQFEQMEKVEKEFKAYSLYLEAIHHKGVPYTILLKMLPRINYEINKILSNVVPFNIVIENPDEEEKKTLEVWIEYPNEEKRLLNLGSGMEKVVSAIAIRAALMSISNLPRFNIFLIDEGFGALDPENLSASHSMFTYLCNIFDNVIIITHIDSLKDIVDCTIDVKRDDEGASYFYITEGK